MSNPALTFIGGGNMARSLVGGLLQTGWPAEKIVVSDPGQPQLDAIRALHPALTTTSDNLAAAQHARVVVLSVKPQVMRQVLEPLAASIQKTRPLLISIAAGLRECDINRWLGGGLEVVRCMPNTPAMVQRGATGLYANALTSSAHRALAEQILQAVGIAVWVDSEALIDVVTALSGSGPAYHFLVMEAMEAAAIELGLPPAVARQLSIQTALGAATLADSSDQAPAELRRQVTSPGGTTEQALLTLESGGLIELFARALQAAAVRANELAEQLGKE